MLLLLVLLILLFTPPAVLLNIFILFEFEFEFKLLFTMGLKFNREFLIINLFSLLLFLFLSLYKLLLFTNNILLLLFELLLSTNFFRGISKTGGKHDKFNEGRNLFMV